MSEELGLADNDVRDKIIAVLSVSDVQATCTPLSISQSRILPSVEIVTTCHGMNFPLCCKAVFAACSSPPQQGTSIRTTMMLGLVFIETAIIYALIVAILIIFVL